MSRFFFIAILCSLLQYYVFLSLTVGGVDDHMLFPNQMLVPGQTLLSQNQVFEMGFFSPGKSLNRFLGIWYKSTPNVIFWVANRNTPISRSQAPVFMISINGSLAISSSGIIIWLVNSSRIAKNPVLELQDSGNLVLVDNSSTTYMWESFDHPTDTIIPGMKMEDDVDRGVERYLTSWRNPDDPSPGDFVHKIHNGGLAEVVTLRGDRKSYRVGQWNGMYFCGGARFPSPIYNPDLVFIRERLISIGEPYQSSLIVRTRLDITGTLLRHTLNLRKDKWNLAITFPKDSCNEYASCGPNSMCRPETPIRCKCFRGYSPKFQNDWDLQDWSGGCDRITPLNCEGGDGFVEVRGVKYPDMLSFWLNTSMSLEECRDECLKNCSCTAYANTFITNGGSGCLLWFSDLVDTRQVSDADSKQNLYIRVPLSMKLILVSIVSGILVSAIINGGLLFMARRKRRGIN